MSKPTERDDSKEKHISDSDDVTSRTTANDAIVNDSSQQKVFESAQSCINQDSISELQLKALDPADPLVAQIQSNRFELIDESSETFSRSELQLKALEKETKDPVLKVIQGLADFVRGLAKNSNEREALNELRRSQQKERLEQIASSQPIFDAPLVMPPPENLEHRVTNASVPIKDLPPSKMKQIVNPNVSKEFRTRVDYFSRQIPSAMQDALVRSGVSITVYAHSSDVPANLANQHARGHSQDQLTKNLPMFYEARNKSLVFIEHPALTSVEQGWKDDVEDTRKKQSQKGIQDFGPLKNYDPKASRYAPIERNGWHELGHAIDQAVLNGLTKRADYNVVFQKEVAAINEFDRKDLWYFTSPDSTSANHKTFERAKQEVFAQLFLTIFLPRKNLNVQDLKLMKSFPQTFKLIKADAKKLHLDF